MEVSHELKSELREQVDDLRKELLEEGCAAGKINPHINQYYDRLIVLLELHQ